MATRIIPEQVIFMCDTCDAECHDERPLGWMHVDIRKNQNNTASFLLCQNCSEKFLTPIERSLKVKSWKK